MNTSTQVFINLFNKFKIKYLIVALLTILSPIKPLMLLVGMVIFADFVSGICKSFKLNIKITSNVMSRTVIKMFVYQAVIIGVFFIDGWLVGELVSLIINIPYLITKGVCIGLIYLECLSINENIEQATKINIFKAISNAIKSGLNFRKTLKEFTE